MAFTYDVIIFFRIFYATTFILVYCYVMLSALIFTVFLKRPSPTRIMPMEGSAAANNFNFYIRVIDFIQKGKF